MGIPGLLATHCSRKQFQIGTNIHDRLLNSMGGGHFTTEMYYNKRNYTQRATVMEAKPMLSYYEATILVSNIDFYLIPVCFLLGPWNKYMQLHQQKTIINL